MYFWLFLWQNKVSEFVKFDSSYESTFLNKNTNMDLLDWNVRGISLKFSKIYLWPHLQQTL